MALPTLDIGDNQQCSPSEALEIASTRDREDAAGSRGL